MMYRYFRVTLAESRKVIWLENQMVGNAHLTPTRHGRFLVGKECNREGDTNDTIHVIDVSAIRRLTEYRMDNHYGELVRKGTVAI